MSTTRAVDVMIVGAGPTGLLLAGDLAAAGVRTVVLEQRAEQDQNLTRAFAVHARTLEELDARGIADDLVATGTKVPDLQLFGTVSIDLSTVHSRFPYLLVTPQYRTEQLLADRAAAHGASVVRGAHVESVQQQHDGVRVHTTDGTDYRASYLVGTDGVHSTVRDQLGLPYPGESVVRSVVLADVRLDREPRSTLTVNGTGDCFAFVAPFGDGWYRVICWDRHRQFSDDASVELSEIAHTLRRALGDDHGVHGPRWMSRFHSDERQVPSYRQGRVFLAGDAAHCHSPAGGMGMNTGLQDAANLGWKLAAVIRNKAPDWLLDSYHKERYPVGQQVLRLSGALIRNGLIASEALLAVRSMLAGVLVRVGFVRKRMVGMLTGLGIGYPAPPGSHSISGQRIPDIALVPDASDGSDSVSGQDSAAEHGNPSERGGEDGHGGPLRMYQALRAGRFVLVGADVPVEWQDRVIGVRPVDQRLPVTLVRPDGYVAWAGVNANRLPEALREWLGPEAAHSSVT